jgi:amino acid adenylation domain-containing protein
MNGGIYVPLDPYWPPERIRTTLAECTPRLVILKSSGDLPAQIPSWGVFQVPESSADILIVENGKKCLKWQDALSGSGKRFEEPVIRGDSPALILFTSGSTGRPKGVMLSHSAVSAFVIWAAGEFDVDKNDRLACPSPLSFDLSTFDIYAMALRGASCVIVSDRIIWMPRFLTQFMHEQNISVWYSVPSILTSMLFDGRLEQYQFPELRVIAFAGEVFSSHILKRWRAVVPRAIFYNLYGPTETNVVAYFQIPEAYDFNGPIPIGKACPYAELALIHEENDENNRDGSGDLVVSGESVMSGYWNRPDETADSFCEIPNSRSNYERFYKTGDRVRKDALSGNFTFLGRKDRQVKRRGFRIELDEIEDVFRSHPRVVEAATLASQDRLHQTTVITFVRFHSDESVSESDLKIYSSARLPGYMIPDRIIPVQAMPRGKRGKTDYRELKEMLRRMDPSEH